MPISIPLEFKQFVRERIASGRFRSEEEVVSLALRLLRECETKRDALLQDLQIGLDELAHGAVITDQQGHHQFFEDIERRGRERQKPHDAT